MANLTQTLPPGATFDPKRGIVFPQPPAAVDDLTRIRGLGASVQEQLYRLGVFRFEQIAAWTPGNVAEYARLLSCFQDRIDRNYWVWQAQKLADNRANSSTEMAAGITERKRKPSTFPASSLRTVVVLSLALMLGMFLVNWLQMRANREFTGNVFAQVSVIKATRNAHLSELLVNKGDAVHEHQDVLVLIDDRGSERVAELQRDVSAFKVALDKSLASAEVEYNKQLREIDQQILQARMLAENEIQPEQQTVDYDEFGRMKSVSHQRFTADADSERVVRIDRNNYQPLIFFRPDNGGDDAVKAVVVELDPPPQPVQPIVNTIQRDLCEKRIRELNAMKDSLRRDIQQASGIRVAEMEYNHALDALEKAQNQNNEFVVRSARHGQVARVLRTAGSQVKMGEPVLQLVNNKRRHVVVSVSADRVSEFVAGQEVDVLFGGNQKRRGIVQDASLEVASMGSTSESTIPVTVIPKGRLWPSVPLGSSVKVAIR